MEKVEAYSNINGRKKKGEDFKTWKQIKAEKNKKKPVKKKVEEAK